MSISIAKATTTINGAIGVKNTAKLVSIYPIDVYIMDGSIYGISHLLTKSACLLLVFIEALSVDENIRAINKDKGAEFYFKKLLHLIRKGKEAITDIKKKL